MLVTRLDTENADRDLTTYVTCLTHTPDASKHTYCQAVIKLGDGTKNLDGSGGDFLVKVTVGGQTVQPSPFTVTFSTDVRAVFFTMPFMVPANNEVVVQVQSPNAGDSDVDVTADLYDIGTVDVVAANGEASAIVSSVDGITVETLYKVIKAWLTGRAVEAPAGTWTFYAEDGTTVIYTIDVDADGGRAVGGTIS
jgi:hypothetical protein